MEWVSIDGFDDYEVSSEGFVRNKASQIVLKPYIEWHGYQEVYLFGPNGRKSCRVHRLVGEAFLLASRPPDDSVRIEISHKNGEILDNRLCNLHVVVKQLKQDDSTRRTINEVRELAWAQDYVCDLCHSLLPARMDVWDHKAVCYECKHAKAYPGKVMRTPRASSDTRKTKNLLFRERLEAGARQDWKCFLCTAKLPVMYHTDHIVSKARGGSNDPSNLQAICPNCHAHKTLRNREYRKQPVDIVLHAAEPPGSSPGSHGPATLDRLTRTSVSVEVPTQTNHEATHDETH